MKLFYCILCAICFSGCFQNYQGQQKKLIKIKLDSVLCLDLKGTITGETAQYFMKKVRDYAGNEKIKGILIRLDSPGGSVGASQEINSTIKNIRTFYKKPVVISAGDIMASGGVLSAMSANQIFVNPGTLFGSIGVIGEFTNLEELARFAKIDVYHIKAGEFKDTGSAFREMTLRERELIENMMDTLHRQFKQIIIEGRGLKPLFVERFSDGRVFTGEEAVAMGLADKIGTYNEAVRAVGKLSGLGSDPHLFIPEDHSFFGNFRKYFGSNGVFSSRSSFINYLIKPFFQENLRGKPLFILPSYLGL